MSEATVRTWRRASAAPIKFRHCKNLNIYLAQRYNARFELRSDEMRKKNKLPHLYLFIEPPSSLFPHDKVYYNSSEKGIYFTCPEEALPLVEEHSEIIRSTPLGSSLFSEQHRLEIIEKFKGKMAEVKVSKASFESLLTLYNSDKQIIDDFLDQIDGDDEIFTSTATSISQSLDSQLNNPAIYFIGDKKAHLYHDKNSKCIDSILPENLVVMGERPDEGFKRCPICRQYREKIMEEGFIPNWKIHQKELIKLCESHGLVATVHRPTIYITSLVGEWYFDYNKRPITLKHKSGGLVHNPKNTGFHDQNVKPSTPAHAISYIKAHEEHKIKHLFVPGTWKNFT